MLHLGLLPVRSQSLEVLQAIAFLRPTIDRSRRAQKIQREACHRAIAPLKCTNEGRAKDLARQLLALEVDQIHVARETLRHDLAEVVDQLGIPKLQRHDHGNPNHLGLNVGVPVALDQGTKSIRAGVGVRSLSGRLSLRQQKVGIKSKSCEFIRRGG